MTNAMLYPTRLLKQSPGVEVEISKDYKNPAPSISVSTFYL